MRLVGNEGGARWTALLGVARAARADTGVFSCQAAVRGRQQCRALRLHVLAPEVRLAPMSVTAHKVANTVLFSTLPNQIKPWLNNLSSPHLT